MEELEISEIKFSKAVNVKNEHRWDSEYYLKKYLKTEELLQGIETNTFLSKTKYIKKGVFDLPPSNYKDSGIPLIRTSEIKNPTINFRSTVFLNESTNKANEKTILNPNDLVFTKIGAYIGDVSLLPTKFSEYNFSQNVAGAKLINHDEGAFLLAFFLSGLGRNQILRSIMLSGQGKLELDDIRQYKIPNLSSVFKKKIKQIIDNEGRLSIDSEGNYQKAENILLQEIGLQDFEENTEAINVKSFSESFGVSGRLDAEYYQKKYEDVVNKVILQNHDILNNLVSISKSVEPGSANYDDEGLPFMRVADYSKFGLTKPNKNVSLNYVTANADKIKKLKPKKGTILFSKDGSVGTAYHLREDFNGITSGAILHLKVKDEAKVIPEYLTLALNSKVVKMQAERDAGGSIILHWRVGEIENVVVPIIDFNKQKQIAKLIEESFKLKKESEYLLEVAKTAVEVAIEQNETKALKYIADNTSLV